METCFVVLVKVNQNNTMLSPQLGACARSVGWKLMPSLMIIIIIRGRRIVFSGFIEWSYRRETETIQEAGSRNRHFPPPCINMLKSWPKDELGSLVNYRLYTIQWPFLGEPILVSRNSSILVWSDHFWGVNSDIVLLHIFIIQNVMIKL